MITTELVTIKWQDIDLDFWVEFNFTPAYSGDFYEPQCNIEIEILEVRHEYIVINHLKHEIYPLIKSELIFLYENSKHLGQL